MRTHWNWIKTEARLQNQSQFIIFSDFFLWNLAVAFCWYRLLVVPFWQTIRLLSNWKNSFGQQKIQCFLWITSKTFILALIFQYYQFFRFAPMRHPEPLPGHRQMRGRQWRITTSDEAAYRKSTGINSQGRLNEIGLCVIRQRVFGLSPCHRCLRLDSTGSHWHWPRTTY